MNKFIKIIRIFFVLILFENSFCLPDLISQQVVWKHTFGGLRDDFGWNTFQTNDGGFLMVAERKVLHIVTQIPIPQTYLIKFDFYGNVEWQKTYGDSLRGNYSYSAVEDDFGNFYVPYISDKAYLMKIDSAGNVLWNKGYADSMVAFGDISFIDNDNRLMLTGEVFSKVVNYYTASLTKVDTSGNLIWTKPFYDTAGFAGIYTIGLHSLIFEDAYYICGGHRGRGFVIKTDTSGNIIWERLFSIVSYLYTMVQNSDRTFISSGYHYTQKFDSSGNLIWQRSYGEDTLAVFGYSMVKTSNNHFALIGGGAYGYGKIFVIDSLGNPINRIIHNYQPQNLLSYRSINNTSDSGFIIAGNIRISDQHFPDAIILKTDKNGNTVNINALESEISNFDFKVEVFPNPFNPETNIKLNVFKTSDIEVEVYNIIGQRVQQLVDKKLTPREYNIRFNALNLQSGIYFIVIKTKSNLIVKKILFLK